MRKFLVICFVFLLVLTSCASANEIRPKSYISWANWTDNETVLEYACNKEKLLEDDSESYPLYKCESIEELKDFKEKYSGIFVMESSWDEVGSFESMTERFDEKFFEKNTLFLVYVTSGSTTPRFKAESVTFTENSLCINIVQTNRVEVGDDAMAGWLIAVPLSKESLRGIVKYDAQ